MRSFSPNRITPIDVFAIALYVSHSEPGSTNFTHTGTHKNLNHIVIFHWAYVCRVYQEEFDEIRSGTFGAHRSREESEPRTYMVSGVPVQIAFAPDHAPELEFVKQMLKAEARIDFAIFTFSGSSGIDDALAVLQKADIDVRGLLDPGMGKMSWAATPWLHDKSIDLRFPNRSDGFGKLHHKLMVVDDAIVVGGSMNYTRPANRYNDENIFIIGSPYEKLEDREVDQKECAKIGNYFRTEIDRMAADSEVFEPGT